MAHPCIHGGPQIRELSSAIPFAFLTPAANSTISSRVSSDGILPRAMMASNLAVLRTNPDAGECREEAYPLDRG